MIDLTIVDNILDEVDFEVTALNGRSHEDDGLTGADRAELSRRLNALADRLDLAAAMARHEYWKARGHTDHLNRSAS